MYKNGVILGSLILLLDQITKMVILKFLGSSQIAVLPFFNLVLVWNRGVSFGMFSDQGHYTPLFLSIISLMIIGMLIVWAMNSTDKWVTTAICVIIAGALGNVIDRIKHGAVVDFLDFHAFGWHYPAFNIADSAIVLGIAFVLFDSIFLEAKRNGSQSNETKR